MGIAWLEREELIPAVLKGLEEAYVILDIGCGIRPQKYVMPFVHICCEPCEEYVEHIGKQLAGQYDRSYVILKASWAEALKLFPPKSVDSVFLIDVIEHLEKEEARTLLKATEGIAKGQIAVFTPLGFMAQNHFDGKDAWGLGGGIWQEHRSGWMPEDFDSSWEMYASRAFHKVDNMGRDLQRARGAFWALKTFKTIGSQDQGDKEKKRLIHMLLNKVNDLNPHEIRIAVLINRIYGGLKRRVRRFL
jgi:hypothetical protein